MTFIRYNNDNINIKVVLNGDCLLTFNNDEKLSIITLKENRLIVDPLNITCHTTPKNEKFPYMHLDKFHGNYIENAVDDIFLEEIFPKSNYYYFLHVKNGYGEVFIKTLDIVNNNSSESLLKLYNEAKDKGYISTL